MKDIFVQKTVFNTDIIKPGCVIRYKNADIYEGNLAIVTKSEPEKIYIIECRKDGYADSNAITLADIDRGMKIFLELEPDEYRENLV